MRTNIKYTVNNQAKYLVHLPAKFFGSKKRQFIFRTKEQLVDFLEDATLKGYITKLKDNGLGLILFTYKNKEMALVVKVTTYPKKRTTTYIELKYILSTKSKMCIRMKEYCGEENIFNLTDYKIPTRLIVRAYIDIHVDTFHVYNQQVSGYISNFVYHNKEYFLAKYNSGLILQKIAGAFFSKENMQNLKQVVNKEPFWIWLEEEHEEDAYMKDWDKFLCCISIIKKRKNKQPHYQILLDQVHKYGVDMKISRAKECNEKIFEHPLIITSKKVQKKNARKVSNTGLKIVRKKEKDKR